MIKILWNNEGAAIRFFCLVAFCFLFRGAGWNGCESARAATEVYLSESVTGGGASSATTAAGGGVPTTDIGRLTAAIEKWAQRAADFIESLGYLGKIIKAITTVIQKFQEAMEKLFKWVQNNTFTKLMTKWAELKAQAKMVDAKRDASVAQTFTEIAMETRAKHTQPRNEHLCKVTRAFQLALTTDEFEQAVACLALSGIDGLYRGDKQDGAGPKYAIDMIKLRCALKLGSKIDGFSDDCIDTSTTDIDGRKLADMDLSAFPSRVLEVPEFKSKSVDGVTYSLPDPKTTEQKFWVAAWYYCIQLAGPRPTPPRKDLIMQPGHIETRAAFDHGLAMSSALSWPCAQMLAYHTRPNSTASALRTSQNEKCLAVKNAGVTLDSSFGDCTKGISQFQRHEMEMAICMSNQNYISLAHSGAPHPDLMAAISDCTSLVQAINSQRATRKNGLTRAAAAASRIRQYWIEVGRQ